MTDNSAAITSAARALLDQADARMLAEGRVIDLGDDNRLPASPETLRRAQDAGDTELADRIAAAIQVQPGSPAPDESPRRQAVNVKYEIAALLEREFGDNFAIVSSGLGPACWFDAVVGGFEVRVLVRPRGCQPVDLGPGWDNCPVCQNVHDHVCGVAEGCTC